MQLLNQFLRGVVIGVANIIPGVSGGTMMVSMGIYDTLIHCITHIVSEFKQSVKTLWPYALGMLAGILALASLLELLFERYPLPTSTAFIGLILGGLSPLFHKIDRRKIGAAGVIVFLLLFAGIIALALIGTPQNPESLTLNAGQIVLLVLVGMIASATMLVPGVSGSMMLMLMGYYTPVLGALNAARRALTGGGLAALATPLLTLAPFCVGVVLGIFFVAKLIEWLLRRFPTPTYCGVLGLVLASPVAILLQPTSGLAGTSAAMAAIGVLTFAAGFVLAAWLAKGTRREDAGA